MKQLFIQHSSFGSKVNYRSWHKGVKVEEDMSFWGLMYLFFLLLSGWRLVDYGTDCAVFRKGKLPENDDCDDI